MLFKENIISKDPSQNVFNITKLQILLTQKCFQSIKDQCNNTIISKWKQKPKLLSKRFGMIDQMAHGYSKSLFLHGASNGVGLRGLTSTSTFSCLFISIIISPQKTNLNRV